MSYKFDATNEKLSGTFTSNYTFPFTIGVYVYLSDHPYPTTSATAVFAALGTTSGSNTDSLLVGSAAVDNRYKATYRDSVPASRTATKDRTNDADWVGFVATFTNDDARSLYIDSEVSPGSNTDNGNVSGGLWNDIKVGEGLDTAEDLGTAMSALGGGFIAEVAMWNVVLDSTDIAAYMTGTAASSIQAANLVGYWPLDADNATQSNLGLDAGGDLTVSGATYDASHPTITPAGGPATATMGRCIYILP